MIGTAKRFLRSPRVIVAELAGLALLCALGASLPQSGTATPAELARLHESGPFVVALVETFALDHIFRSPLFMALTLLSAVSLLVIVIGQVKRLRSQWFQRLGPAQFQSAPFRVQFERPARLPLGQATTKVWSKNRLGLAGSAIFHTGLLLVMLAGVLRALFGADAVVDLFEGETLPPTARAWAAQWPGLLARPVQFEESLTLNRVHVSRYPSGDLKELTVNLEARRPEGVEKVDLAVNHDAHLAGQRLFLGREFGPTVFVEWQNHGGSSARQAVLLAPGNEGVFEGCSIGPGNLRAYLRTVGRSAGDHPTTVEVRVMKDNALLFSGDTRVQESVSLFGGDRLVLHGAAFWARLRGSRDGALWLAYTGFALVLAGITLIFCVVRVDGCLVVTPAGDWESVFLAVRPQRFSAAYGDYFRSLVRQQGGDPGTELPPGAAPARSPDAAKVPTPMDGPPQRSPVELSGATPRLAAWILLGVCLAALPGCQRSSMKEARQLVERYNQVVSEAYRRGDVRLIDPVVGPNEGRKLTGLIGVRTDLGITLDSRLLSLLVTHVDVVADEMRVHTKERWHYRDLRIGTGQQVGEESLDAYEMLYIFKRIDKAWLVDEIKFASPPQVGRKKTPWVADRQDAHALGGPSQGGEGRQP
jgi:hypothetical protein